MMQARISSIRASTLRQVRHARFRKKPPPRSPARPIPLCCVHSWSRSRLRGSFRLCSSGVGHGAWSGWIWAACAAPVLLVLIVQIVTSLRRGDVGLDIVAALSMTARSGVRRVSGRCGRRADVCRRAVSRELRRASCAPRNDGTPVAHTTDRRPAPRRTHSKRLSLDHDRAGRSSAGDEGATSFRSTVRSASGLAVLDQSALTGESIPVQQLAGAAVMSGSTNAGDAFDLIASRRAAESTYAGIVRLVEAAQRSKAPMSRLADRIALVFLGLTVVIAGAAWLWTGDPIRAVAVLVVATPCPLILAVPVAIISGLSRAAKHGVLIKGRQGAGGSGARYASVVIDKTGTLTEGRARVVSVRSAPGVSTDELLRDCGLARPGLQAHRRASHRVRSP